MNLNLSYPINRYALPGHSFFFEIAIQRESQQCSFQRDWKEKREKKIERATTDCPTMRVVKIGGSSVAKIPTIVMEISGDAIFVVSAVGGLTDVLMKGHLLGAAHAFRQWMKRHNIRMNENILEVMDAMMRTVPGSPLSVSYGEKLTVVALAEMMKEKGKKAAPIFADSLLLAEGNDAYDAMLLTGNDDEREIENLRLLAISKGIVPIVTGYCARHHRTAETVLLGRDGSDYTAAHIAGVLRATCAIVTDVSGIMTCDPRIVPTARSIPCMSTGEARELAFHGASVIHRKTLRAVGDSPLWVVDIFGRGTVIRDQEESLNRPLAIALLDNRRCLTVEARSEVGFSAKIFSKLKEVGISVEMMAQTCSETEIAVILPESKSKIAAEALREVGETARLSEKLGVITVVGDGMTRKEGTLTSIFSVFDRLAVRVHWVSQGIRSLSIAVASEDLQKSARHLHDRIL